MKYKSTTADILNDADSLERKLDWILFKAEMDHIWNGGEDEWRPGDPLHSRHLHARPMYQLIPTEVFNNGGVRRFVIRCVPCGVSWQSDEPCWMCGEERVHRGILDYTDFYIAYDEALESELQNYSVSTEQFRDAMGNLSSATAEFSASLSGVGEQMLEIMRAYSTRDMQFVRAMDRHLRSFYDVETHGSPEVGTREVTILNPELPSDMVEVDGIVMPNIDPNDLISYREAIQLPEISISELESRQRRVPRDPYWADWERIGRRRRDD